MMNDSKSEARRAAAMNLYRVDLHGTAYKIEMGYFAEAKIMIQRYVKAHAKAKLLGDTDELSERRYEACKQAWLDIERLKRPLVLAA